MSEFIIAIIITIIVLLVALRYRPGTQHANVATPEELRVAAAKAEALKVAAAKAEANRIAAAKTAAEAARIAAVAAASAEASRIAAVAAASAEEIRLAAVAAATEASRALAAHKWTRSDNMTQLHTAGVAAGGNSATGDVKYIGSFPTRDACETACGANTWCNSYTWHDNNAAANGAYVNQCFGVATPVIDWNQPHVYSGRKPESFLPSWDDLQTGAGHFYETIQRQFR